MSPKRLSIGLHDRLTGRPGRSMGLIGLLDYTRGFDDVWFCTGADSRITGATNSRTLPDPKSERDGSEEQRICLLFIRQSANLMF